MSIGNQEFIRNLNKTIVLKTLMEESPLSRADLSKKCNLTKATISSIVQELLDEYLIQEIGSGDASFGRKPILLRFNPSCGYAVSISIGPEEINVLISDLKGENCSLKNYPHQEFEITVEEIKNIIQKTIDQIPHCPYGIVGICIGVYGVVHNNEIIFTPHYYIKEKRNICQILTDYFHIPIFIENDANLSVLGESYHHYDNQNMIYINVHSGIGAGILLNGRIFKGKKGYAGEIGHSILYPNGISCPCGNKGCLEQYASEKALLDEYCKNKNLPGISLEQFIQNYQTGDPFAIETIEKFILYMTICINNLIVSYNPELIIINCRFTNFIPGILEEIQNRTDHPNADHVTLTIGETQDMSELLGGISICCNHFFHLHN